MITPDPADRPAHTGRWRAVAGLAAVALVIAVAGCTGGGARKPRGAAAVPSGTVTVLADAAFGMVLGRVAKQFQEAYRGTEVIVTLGPSAALAARVAGGEAADVLITADAATMGAAGAAVSGPPLPFARTQLVIAVAPDNPKRVSGLADLARKGVRVAICAASEPCGTAATAVFAAAGVGIPKVTRVPDVATALKKVTSGAADAALVYRTDTRAAGDKVSTVEFAESSAAVGECQAAAVATSANPVAANAFVDFLHTPAGQDQLSSVGFRLP
ncbi:molybdate ABC transporter substrate-binding protein [Luedemannella helvata]|uniref:Molybdate ABC transporter substrate-binding protein n=1 Tax=Luedemannella helvata TaxID=349315 RepID=A0ABN2JR62_9ACTN